MKIPKIEKINDEIKRLERLTRKTKADSRNKVRLEKIKALKEIKDTVQKLKFKKISPKQYSIQYKDLKKKYKSVKQYRKSKAITEDDIKSIDRYAGIYDWKNKFARGIMTALARGGAFDELLGFEFSSYVSDDEAINAQNFEAIFEKLKESEQEFYNILDKYFLIDGLTFDDITLILKNEIYRADLDELFYIAEQPQFDFKQFELRLLDLMDDIRENMGLQRQSEDYRSERRREKAKAKAQNTPTG